MDTTLTGPPPTMAVRFSRTGVPFWSKWIEGVTVQVMMPRPKMSAYLIRIPRAGGSAVALSFFRRGEPIRIQLASEGREIDLVGVMHQFAPTWAEVACPITSLAQPRLVP